MSETSASQEIKQGQKTVSFFPSAIFLTNGYMPLSEALAISVNQ